MATVSMPWDVSLLQIEELGHLRVPEYKRKMSYFNTKQYIKKPYMCGKINFAKTERNFMIV